MAKANVASKVPVASRPKPYAISNKAGKSPKVELMLLKIKAKGDGNVQLENRFYARIHLPDHPKIPEQLVYFPRSWPLGRWLDVVIGRVGLVNKNNLATGPKWMFLLSGGDATDYTTVEDPLPLNEPVADLCAQGVLPNPSSLTLIQHE